MIASQGAKRGNFCGRYPLSEGIYSPSCGCDGCPCPIGAKLISVIHENFGRGIQSTPGSRHPIRSRNRGACCAVHAGEITAIRTAAASAVATDALARKDAGRLALLAMANRLRPTRGDPKIRTLKSIVVGGGRANRAHAFASGSKRTSLYRCRSRGRREASR